MKKNGLVFLSALTVLGFAFSITTKEGNEVVRDKEVIVELKDVLGTDVSSREEVEQTFKSELQSLVGYNYRIKNNYKHIANALILEVNSNDVDSIKSLDLVENLNDVKTYTYSVDEEDYSFNPDDTSTAPSTNYSREEMNTPSSGNDGSNTIVAVLDDSFNINHEIFKDLSGDYRYTKSEITSLKNTSGFHAKAAAYKDNKIPFYYNYGNSNTSMSYTNNTEYHGQHVSGIVGGNNKYNGVSPNAQLALMKVTDGQGNFTDTGIMNALEDCVILNVDAINMSFGVGVQDFDSNGSYKSIYKKMEEQGISINLATGNDGHEQFSNVINQNTLTSSVEDGLIGGDAVNDYTTSVAALNLENDVTIASSLATADGDSFRVKEQLVNHTYYDDSGVSHETNYSTIYPFYSLIESGQKRTTLDYVVVPNYGIEADYSDIDVNGKIAVVQRGGATSDDDPNVNLYTFVAKVTNAVKHGAKAVIIYNNVGATSEVGYFNLDSLSKQYYVPVGYVNSASGILLKNATKKQIVITKEMAADYTSDGATSELKLKPDISAPGTNIYSSTGPSTSKYAYYSGTSMASPNYTGAYVNVLSNYENIEDETKRDEYRKSLSSRIMSTADPVLQANGAYASPRLVGAGAVDISDAINSDVYLEGNVENKAKVELKNTDDIKSGRVKFSVTTHNETSSTKKYKATLYVEAPELVGLDAVDGTFLNSTYKTSKDVLLTTSTSTVSIVPGDSSISFDTSITSENKEYLKNFENGTYLEGYVILEAMDGSEDLNIPYMGFYGDFASEDCVEPFSYEKDENTVYGSDMLNALLDTSDNYKNGDFSSMIVALGGDLSDSQYSNVIANKASFLSYGKAASYDSENNEYVLGAKGVSDHFIIQQFVNRSVLDNKITVTSKDTGEVVYTDAMFSMLDPGSTDTQHSLYRSEMTQSLYSSGYFADRAYTFISLVDSSGNLLYPEGVYEWKFEYTLPSGTVQTKTINIRLSSTVYSNEIGFFTHSIKKIDGEEYLYLRFTGTQLSSLTINNNSFDIKKDTDGYYAEVKVSDLNGSDDLFIEIKDTLGTVSDMCFSISSLGNGGYGIISNDLVNGSIISCDVESVSINTSGYAFTYEFSAKTVFGKDVSLSNEYGVFFEPKDGYSSDSVKVYELDSSGKVTIEQEVSVIDGTIYTKTTSGRILVVYSEKTSSINLLSIILIGFGVVIIVGILLALIILRSLKRHKI